MHDHNLKRDFPIHCCPMVNTSLSHTNAFNILQHFITFVSYTNKLRVCAVYNKKNNTSVRDCSLT